MTITQEPITQKKSPAWFKGYIEAAKLAFKLQGETAAEDVRKQLGIFACDFDACEGTCWTSTDIIQARNKFIDWSEASDFIDGANFVLDCLVRPARSEDV